MAEFTVLKGNLADSSSLSSCYLLQFDGLAVPNPGEATGGAVLFSPDGGVVCERGEYMQRGTNNTAEYTGLLIGLQMALKLGVKNLRIEGDSQLIINQTLGTWKVNNDALASLNKQVRELLGGFDYVAMRHIRREFNAHADALTNEMIKTKVPFTRGPGENVVVKQANAQTHAKTNTKVSLQGTEHESETITLLKSIHQKLDLLLDKLQ
jgi:ribonuclease HI